MAREAAGAVYVQIDGDASPIIQKFAQTEALAKAAGTRIASSLGAGLSSATGLVDQFGRSLSSSIGGAAQSIAGPVQLVAKGVTQVGEAAEHSVPQIAAASGAIRVLEGNLPIRAVERFATSVLGLGPILQEAFPLVGLIATGELISHVVESIGKTSEAEKEAAKQAKQFTNEIEGLDHKVSSLQVTFETLKHGAVAGMKAELEETAGLIDIAASHLEAARQNLQGGEKQVIGGKTYLMPSHASSIQRTDQAAEVEKAGLELHAAQLSVQVKTEELSRKQIEEQKKAASEAKAALTQERTVFKESYDNRLDDLKAFHEVSKGEELRFRQGELSDAKGRGTGFIPVATDVNRQVGSLSQEVNKGIDRTDIEGQKLHAEQAKKDLKEIQVEMTRGLEEASREGERVIDESLREIQRSTAEANRTGQEGIKAGGVRVQSSDEVEKLKDQQSYQLQIVHSRADEISYAKQLAALDEKALSDKISNLTALQEYQDKNALINESLATGLSIEQARAALDKQKLQDQTKLLELTQQTSLAGQIRSAVGSGPATLFDAKNAVIAQTMGTAVNGIAGALGRAVEGGQKLSKVFSELGRSILGELVSAIAKVGIQMAITAVTGKAIGSAIAIAEVTSAAAVGAANAAAATAAIPIVGPALAPAAAAATYAEIMALASLASYDKGGPIFEDQIAQVHKGEYVLTADQVSGRSAMPSLPATGSYSSYAAGASQSVSVASHALSVGAIHLHGLQDVRDVARRLPNVLKAVSPNFSPASR